LASSGQGSEAESKAVVRARNGLLFGLASYVAWGFGPVYFKAVAMVAPLEILAHRIVWSALLLAVLLLGRRQTAALRRALSQRRTVLVLAVTTLLVAVNWLTFIWAIVNDQVLQASLGYYINPLLNVFLGWLFLGERQSRAQAAAIALAVAGVAFFALRAGTVPWPALVLAVTFGLYGLLRKTAPVDALVGLTVETWLLFPLAIGYLIWLGPLRAFAAGSLPTDLLLVMAGPVTALPLLWFTIAARRLRFSTVGFLQYLAPTMQFGLAVAVYGEPFSLEHGVAFGCIWAAVAVYLFDAWRGARAARADLGQSA
jgi:chloramphenicol-sensitive protein RarD